jgi:hypothetical protein
MTSPAPDILTGREVIFEFALIGEWAQVRAIDTATGIEVSASGPASTARHDLQRLGRGKLARALKLHVENGGSLNGVQAGAQPKKGFSA